MSYQIVLPLSVKQTKAKWFHLNLNVYRNTHYQTLNTVKVNYAKLIAKRIAKLPTFSEKIAIQYTLYVGSKRKCDISNVCCIVDKFFCDELTKACKIPDDNYDVIPEVSYCFGGYRKNHPHVIATIYTIQELENEN